MSDLFGLIVRITIIEALQIVGGKKKTDKK